MTIEPNTNAPCFYWTPGSPELTTEPPAFAPEPRTITLGDKTLPATPEQVASYARLLERHGQPDEIAPMFFGDGCILVRFGGLWIGIENDGYAHS